MTDILDPAKNAQRRNTVLATARRSLKVDGDEAPRRAAVVDRLATHPAGVVPARGQLDAKGRVDLFETMAKAVDATVARVADAADVPNEVADFLRQNNLPQQIRHGSDARLDAIPWENQKTLEVSKGIAEDATTVGVSHAFGGVAESGTLILTSGGDNPTTLNFLPETHIVLIDANDIDGDYETVVQRLRDRYGAGEMPRTVNMVTGPSRSADIEQTLLLGAHGPRRLHIVIVGA